VVLNKIVPKVVLLKHSNSTLLQPMASFSRHSCRCHLGPFSIKTAALVSLRLALELELLLQGVLFAVVTASNFGTMEFICNNLLEDQKTSF
jgi:hypothetical protein